MISNTSKRGLAFVCRRRRTVFQACLGPDYIAKLCNISGEKRETVQDWFIYADKDIPLRVKSAVLKQLDKQHNTVDSIVRYIKLLSNIKADKWAISRKAIMAEYTAAVEAELEAKSWHTPQSAPKLPNKLKQKS